VIESSSLQYRRLWIPDLAWILLLLIVATAPFLNPTLDLKLLSWFYEPDLNQHPWPLKFNGFFRALYTFGTLPALVTALTGLGILVATRYRPALTRWRRHAAFLFLALVIGPGLFVNTLFKDNWGRPRPKMVTEFRGRLNYQSFYERGTKEQGKSFPCGHSSMGYYFVVLYFLARRRRKLIRLSLLAGAMLYGTLMGITRMTAGAHFASDVLWSAVFPCLAAWGLYFFVFKIPFHEDQPRITDNTPVWQPRWLLWLAPPLAAATIAAVLLGTPALLKIQISEPIPTAGLTRVELVVAEPGQPHTDFCFIEQKTNTTISGRIIITGEVQGFGWPWNKIHHNAVWSQTNGMNLLSFTCLPIGKFSELDGQITIEAPAGTQINRIQP
jgi:lipid A 4'-phosphatase